MTVLGSRAWGRVCAAWRVPVGPAEPAAPGRGGTLRRAVLGTWGSGLIAAVSSPQQAYSVALSPHPSECGQCPGHSVLTRQQVAGRLRTEPAGPGIARDPPPRSSGSSERRPGQGCPAEMLLMENPQQPGPRPRCDTHSSRPRGVGGARCFLLPFDVSYGGVSTLRAARAHTRWAATGCALGAWACWGQAGGPRRAGGAGRRVEKPQCRQRAPEGGSAGAARARAASPTRAV